jgi:hypothetical protein
VSNDVFSPKKRLRQSASRHPTGFRLSASGANPSVATGSSGGLALSGAVFELRYPTPFFRPVTNFLQFIKLDTS